MARLRRLGFAGAISHLAGPGNDRQKVFFTDHARELFSEYFRRRGSSLRLDLLMRVHGPRSGVANSLALLTTVVKKK